MAFLGVVGCVRMELNASFPATCQTFMEVDDECKLCTFHEKGMATGDDALGIVEGLHGPNR